MARRRPARFPSREIAATTRERDASFQSVRPVAVAHDRDRSAVVRGPLAFHCRADMKKIDDALARNPKLTAEQLANVKKYRADGEALHKAGKDQESVDTLAKAMKILNIQ